MRPFGQLKELLPDYYDGVLETDLLMDVEEDLFAQLFSEMEKAQSNQYISTADSNILSLWESILRIHVNSTDDIELRRIRVLSRMLSQKPYTLRYFRELVENIGADVTVNMLYDEYKMLIHSYFEKNGQVNELDYLIKTIVPANILVEAFNELRVKQKRNEIYIATGLVVTENVMITQDILSNKEIHANVTQSIATIPTFIGTMTNDINEQAHSEANANTASAIVNTEEVIIR